MFGLSFLSPLFLAGVAAAAIPVALHLFYRRTEPVVEFAAMRYLRSAPVEQSRRRRLRELILLALRIGALVLLAGAFARPYVSGVGPSLEEGATVVLVDVSASLTAPGQFDVVRERAAAAVREAPASHAVGVLAFAQTADVIAPLSRDRAGALAAVGALKPGAGATRYTAALQRAAEELGGRPGRIVVVTDLQQTGWDPGGGGVPERVSVELAEVGGPDGNLAVTSLRVEGGGAVAAVQNYSSRALSEQVIFAAGDRRIGSVAVNLQPGGTTEARLPLGAVASGALSASVSDRDGYAADNVRYAVIDPASAVSVLALTASGHPSECLYLDRALAVVDGAGGFRFSAVSASGFGALDEASLEDVDVLVVLGTRGLEQRGRERLLNLVRGGRGLLLTAGPDVEPAVVRQALSEVVATSWRLRNDLPVRFAPEDARHPVFRPFGDAGTLGNVSFTRTARIEPPSSASVVARYTDGSPAIVEERTGRGRVLVFASDLNYGWNDFPLQPAFLPFIHEALRYLASPQAGRAEYLVGELAGPAGLAPGVVALPDVSARRMPPGSPGVPGPSTPSASRRAVSNDDARPAAGAGSGKRVAVNVDVREADPQRMTAEVFQAGISRLRADAAQRTQAAEREREDEQSLWRYGLLLMVIGLAAEGLLGRRLG